MWVKDGEKKYFRNSRLGHGWRMNIKEMCAALTQDKTSILSEKSQDLAEYWI